jgi:hypothetical protein
LAFQFVLPSSLLASIWRCRYRFERLPAVPSSPNRSKLSIRLVGWPLPIHWGACSRLAIFGY